MLLSGSANGMFQPGVMLQRGDDAQTQGPLESTHSGACAPVLSISSSLALPLPGPWKGSHFRWGVMAASRTVMAVGRRR
ncbi:unnamed protein product [Rangifer tarandus platyrhynchus]|uniref:Uncharacterized protein n=1 Tax=Rangifer tarandus platyrhynchus TaxID=3082113 RepID=A0AC59YXP8_RANTA